MNVKAGLCGYPHQRGISDGEFSYTTTSGEVVTAVRIGYGIRAALAVEKYAQKNGLGFELKNGNGCTGMCMRMDGVAYLSSPPK